METKKKPYEPPLLTVKDVKVEKGFATSSVNEGMGSQAVQMEGDKNEQMGGINWDQYM